MPRRLSHDDITHIVIHCSDTPVQRDIGADEIRQWHVNQGWKDIGYHFVIRLDGTIERGRPVTMAGAHVRGHNYSSLGICYVGGIDASGEHADTRTPAQRQSMASLVQIAQLLYPNATFVGHRDLDPNRLCPCFDVAAWKRDLVTIDATDIREAINTMQER